MKKGMSLITLIITIVVLVIIAVIVILAIFLDILSLPLYNKIVNKLTINKR